MFGLIMPVHEFLTSQSERFRRRDDGGLHISKLYLTISDRGRGFEKLTNHTQRKELLWDSALNVTLILLGYR